MARAGPVVRVVLESPAVQVGPESEQKLAVAEQGNVPAAGPARSREAVALTVSAVINPQREEAVAPSAEEAAHLPKRPAVAVAPAWAEAAKAEAAAVKAVVAGADR